MKEWQVNALLLLLFSIAISLGVLTFQVTDINRSVDMGKFMPFIYTEQR